MIDLVWSTVQLVWPLIVMALGGIGILLWGNKRKNDGIEEEKERSRKAVNKVQEDMNKETQKSVTPEEIQKKLRDGTF